MTKKTIKKTLKIIVRTPNWLGDLVMCYAFFEQLKKHYPTAIIDVIVKKNIADLLAFFPTINRVFLFDKQSYKGLKGTYNFAKTIQENYDYFFCLPDSFSAAWIGLFLKSTHKIGYKNEMRSLFLTNAYDLPQQNIHRVHKYCQLIDRFQKEKTNTLIKKSTIFKSTNFSDDLQHKWHIYEQSIVLNLVSEDDKRTFDAPKSRLVIEAIQMVFPNKKIVIIGTAKAKKHFQKIKKQLINTDNIIDLSQKTNLIELAYLLQTAYLLVSTDSGPAHLANSLQTSVVVFFGKGHIWETAPYQSDGLKIMDFDTISKNQLIAELTTIIQ